MSCFDRNGTELKVGDRVHVPLVGNNARVTTWSAEIIEVFRDGRFVQVAKHDRWHFPDHCAALCEKEKET